MEVRSNNNHSQVVLYNKLFAEITDTMLTGYCLSMLLEGFETSSGLMSYCLFEVKFTNPNCDIGILVLSVQM